MIQDGIDYGEGFCRSVEPGPDVECSKYIGDTWDKNTDFNTTKKRCSTGPFRTIQESMAFGNRYRQPIKPNPIKLQVGERYRMRNGEIVGPVILDGWHHAYPFSAKGSGATWDINGVQVEGKTSSRDIIEHIPKDKSMNNEIEIEVQGWIGRINQGRICVTLAEAERLGGVAKKMREDMEIQAGDWFFDIDNEIARKCIRREGGAVYFKTAKGEDWFRCHHCTKITNPAHIQALTEIYEGMK